MPVETLNRDRMDAILTQAQDGMRGTGGALGTVDQEGKPYVVPMGFKYVDGAFYMFCDYVGEKVRNLRGNPAVCLEVTHREAKRTSSVIVRGTAEEFKDDSIVIQIWGADSFKRMREHSPKGVYVKITPSHVTGKAYTMST